jgi:hypothetical protein
MIELFLLASLPEGSTVAVPPPLCEGIALIEKSTLDRPKAFASLVVRETIERSVKNAEGVVSVQKREIVKVKPLGGFVDCRFVYNAYISLACYGPSSVEETDAAAVEASLNGFAERVGACLKNKNLSKFSGDPQSKPFIAFSGGAREPFYQISLVPLPDKDGSLRPELLVLGPEPVPEPKKVKSSAAKSVKARPKRK